MGEIMNWFTKETWGFIDALITIATVLGVFYGLYKNWLQSQEVALYFKTEDGKKKKLPITLIRKNVTRSEVSGLLGMLQKNSKDRHNIHFMTTEEYFKRLHTIQNENIKELIIDVSDDEIKQFIC